MWSFAVHLSPPLHAILHCPHDNRCNILWGHHIINWNQNQSTRSGYLVKPKKKRLQRIQNLNTVPWSQAVLTSNRSRFRLIRAFCIFPWDRNRLRSSWRHRYLWRIRWICQTDWNGEVECWKKMYERKIEEKNNTNRSKSSALGYIDCDVTLKFMFAGVWRQNRVFFVVSRMLISLWYLRQLHSARVRSKERSCVVRRARHATAQKLYNIQSVQQWKSIYRVTCYRRPYFNRALLWIINQLWVLVPKMLSLGRLCWRFNQITSSIRWMYTARK